MKHRICVEYNIGPLEDGSPVSLDFKFNPLDHNWDMQFAEGDIFVDVASGRRFVLRFEEVKCVDC